MLSSIANANQRGAPRYARRYAPQRLGFKRTQGQIIASSALFKSFPPSRKLFCHEILTMKGRQSPARPQHSRIATNHHLSAFSTANLMSPGSNMANRPQHGPGNSILKSKSRLPSADDETKKSSRRIVTANERRSREATSRRLSMLLSDVNLRHDKNIRSIVQEHGNRCLPLNSIRLSERFVSDPSWVLEAVNIARDNAAPTRQSPIQIDVETTDSGEILVRRSPPFDYYESVRSSHRKMMAIDGWPTGDKPLWVKSLIRLLLYNGEDCGQIPVTYWRSDNSSGVLNIEFESEEGSVTAWNNLDRAVSQVNSVTESSGHKIVVQPSNSDRQNGPYKIQIGGSSLAARRIDMPMIEKESVAEQEAVKPETSIHATDRLKESLPKPESVKLDGIISPNITEVSKLKTARDANVSSSKSFQAKPKVDNERDRSVQDLSKRLSFFLSDIHLRHNEYIRSILQEHEHQYLPLNSIKSLERFVGDPSIALDAVKISNESSLSSGRSPVQLDVEETEGGETLIKRSPPFNFAESIRDSHRKMMIIEGWPKGPKPRLVKSLVHSLLCDDGASQSPVSYWRFDNSKGVLKIEFESEEGAASAWKNLERAASQMNPAEESPEHKVEVQPLHSDQQNRSFQLQIGTEFSLVVQPVEMPLVEEGSLPEAEVTESERIPDGLIFDDEESKTVSIDRPKSSSVEASADVKETTPLISTEKLYGSYTKWEAKETISIGEFAHVMNYLYQEHIALPPPSREWLQESVRQERNTAEDMESQQQLLARRQDIWSDVENVLSCVKASIDQGKIRALGPKDGYSLTDSLGRAMLIYSEIPSSFGDVSDSKTDVGDVAAVSPYEGCLHVFSILRSLNLDTHPSHFSYAIRAACHECRWEEAAKLFLDQVDGDNAGDGSFMATGGFVPIDPTFGWDRPLEIGLYAVARACELKMEKQAGDTINKSPSEQVFDTAMKMCMISPSGQVNYILAAGLALGRAGLWSDCLDFASAPNATSTYGPSIAAAAMLACIECSRYTEAIYVYDHFMSGNQSAASEWQWAGGNITAVKPLCRDLALHAMGNIRKGGFGGDAVRMFREIIDEDSPISANALLGLAQSFGHDGDLQSSIQLLDVFLDSVYRKKNPKWRILADALELNKNGIDERILARSVENDLLANILTSAMRACNHKRQCGLAILLCSIVSNSYVSENNSSAHNWVECNGNKAVNISLSQKIVTENQQVLDVYINSLHELGCGHIAGELLNNSKNSGHPLASATQGSRQSGLPHAESWTHAFIAMDKVLKATTAISLEGSNISLESRLLFERGLGRAMNHCIDSNQSATALHLFDHTIGIVTRKKKDATLADRVKTFFGMENLSSDNGTSGSLFKSNDEMDLTSLRLNDPVLAAIIKAYSQMGQPEKARSVFQDGTMHLDDLTVMAQSANKTLEALLDIDIDECISFLDTMDDTCVDPSTFLAIARHYARNKIWPEVGEIYNRAREAGCISEDLALITMQAVCESELLDGKIVVLRNIMGDVSTLVGMKRDDWINSKYWGIKRYVGFHHARLLMRWNDPVTSQKEELLFAINEMRQCASEGIATKNAPLECIAKIAQVYGTDGKVESTLTEKQRRSAVNLILEACVEAKRSGLMRKYTFTAEVARSLRALKSNRECIQIVLTLISRGEKCRHRVAMEEAMYAALEERDHESLKLITDVYELSGFDSKRMSNTPGYKY